MATNKDALFPHNEAHSLAYGDCPDCSAPLQLKHVGKSSFIACTQYPKCEYSKSLSQHDISIIKVIENSHCPDCDSELAVKKGRYGMFIGCTNFPSCHYISTKQNTQKKDEYEPVDCPSCKSGQLTKKQNRFGKFFYACNNYPKCKYVLNHEPIARTCPQCSFPIMFVKTKGERKYVCANEACAHVVDESNE